MRIPTIGCCILFGLQLAACSHTLSVKDKESGQSAFPVEAGKWWYKSYMESDCSVYFGLTGYTELTSKTIELDGKNYAELISMADSDYKASRQRILKDKGLSVVGIRREGSQYFLHSAQLIREAKPEQLLFDLNASKGSTWSAYWGATYLKYAIKFSGKEFNPTIADTLYTFAIEQTLVASHVPELTSIVFSPKSGIIGYRYNDIAGPFWSIREDVNKQALVNSCK